MGQFEAFVGVNFWTALFTLLNTLTIYFVAKKFLFKPVMKMIRERQEEIDGMYASADKTCSDAEAMADEYRQKLSAATETSERMVKEAVERGQRREEEIIRQAHAHVVTLSVAVAEKMLRQQLKGEQAQVDLAERILKEMNDR